MVVTFTRPMRNISSRNSRSRSTNSGVTIAGHAFLNCSSRERPGAGISSAMISCDGGTPCDQPGVVQPRTSPCTRCGWFSTNSCAIIPPIDMPSTWALPTPSSRSSPAASSAIIGTLYCTCGLSVSPVPLLEKRTIWKWDRSSSRNRSLQDDAWPLNPMIVSRGGPLPSR